MKSIYDKPMAAQGVSCNGHKVRGVTKHNHEIKYRFVRRYMWRKCGIQTSLAFVDDQTSLEKIFKQKTTDLFKEMHTMIFAERKNYRSVFNAFIEFVSENNLNDDFHRESSSELAMLFRCIEENDGSKSNTTSMNLLKEILLPEP